MEKPPASSWSIHTRSEIVAKYEIFERVGAGTYADVYRARRIADGLTVALKEIFDYQSAFREIDALTLLRGSPNVVVMHEYFWREDENAVLVLEFLKTDLAAVIREAKKRRKNGGDGIPVGEIKRWMIQILAGVDACHRNMVVHRDLKPGNMLISDDGILKLADFGQARILMDPGFVPSEENQQVEDKDGGTITGPPEVIPECETSSQKGCDDGHKQEPVSKDEYFRQIEELKAKRVVEDDTDKESNLHDGDTSCLATCTVSDLEDDDLRRTSFSYDADEVWDDGTQGLMTSCVGTRWFRPPELLYGSTKYGLEVDLWSLGCVFAELLSLEPLFPGISDIDQISRIINLLGNLTDDVWPGCVELPDYNTISFAKVEAPAGVESCLPNHTADEISMVKKLICYNPARRSTASELLDDKYFTEEPLPVPVSELHVPSTRSGQDEDSPGEWHDYREMDSDSEFDNFGPVNVKATSGGFTIEFP
ncbi:PREDICTED: cyclin-dependent kinase F-1 [Tarenaya hassleriana]|uniref:cyclin-dependent kinase F-1 n=1 Tax=Tarenaya hassleriana TaxID=28532 RepID=UPI00053C0F18|nr:PREDICTED: cyclin-dependent kinase F-1 [Tarenaya hassleriana]